MIFINDFSIENIVKELVALSPRWSDSMVTEGKGIQIKRNRLEPPPAFQGFDDNSINSSTIITNPMTSSPKSSPAKSFTAGMPDIIDESKNDTPVDDNTIVRSPEESTATRHSHEESGSKESDNERDSVPSMEELQYAKKDGEKASDDVNNDEKN